MWTRNVNAAESGLIPPGSTQDLHPCCIMHRKTRLNYQHGSVMFLLDPGSVSKLACDLTQLLSLSTENATSRNEKKQQQSNIRFMGMLPLKRKRRWSSSGRSKGAAPADVHMCSAPGISGKACLE
jgi:hypothetical protein